MEKLRSFLRFTDVGLLAIAVLAEQGAISLLRENGVKAPLILLVAAGIVLILAFKVMQWLLNEMIANNSWLRSLILQDDYVEGTWVDLVTIGGSRFLGLFTLEYKNGRVEQSGQQFTSDGDVRATWETVLSKYDNNTLTLVYEVTYVDGERVDRPYGMTVCSFHRQETHAAPKFLSGTFYDITLSSESKSFKGFKVEDKETLKKLEVPSTQRDAVRELLQHSFFGGSPSARTGGV